jgi:hypothetical protein
VRRSSLSLREKSAGARDGARRACVRERLPRGARERQARATELAEQRTTRWDASAARQGTSAARHDGARRACVRDGHGEPENDGRARRSSPSRERRGGARWRSPGLRARDGHGLACARRPRAQASAARRGTTERGEAQARRRRGASAAAARRDLGQAGRERGGCVLSQGWTIKGHYFRRPHGRRRK